MKAKLYLAGGVTILGSLAGAFAQPPPPPGAERTFFFKSAGPDGAGPEQNVSFVSAMRIDGAVVKGSPYSAQAITETTQKLADGNRISRKTTASLYRDSEGRTRREESPILGATPPGVEPRQSIFINDPVAGTSLVLDSATKTAHSMPRATFGGPLPAPPPLPPPPADGEAHVGVFTAGIAAMPVAGVAGAGPLPPDVVMMSSRLTSPTDKKAQKESLGTQMIEGVPAEGTRTTITIPAGEIGNDLPIQIVSERWYSPELQTVVMTKHSDPRMGETVYRLTNILRNEPSPSLFTAPADYKTIEANRPVLMKSK